MKRPIQHCYWVDPGKILAGEYPRNIDEDSSKAKIESLLEAGVTVFIDLTEEDELKPYSDLLPPNVKHIRFPIPDVSAPKSQDATTIILNTVDQHLKQGDCIYIHCWGGVGRTGLIVGCWLSRHGHHSEDAIDRLQELWKQCPKSEFRKSPETKEQENYIINYKDKEINEGNSRRVPTEIPKCQRAKSNIGY